MPLLDHVVRAVQHYVSCQGSTLSAAVTYSAFLSFFPLLALAFAAVGLVAHYVPDAQDDLATALRDLLPGMIGTGTGQISLAELQRAAGAVAGVGAVAVLYSGLSWISEMRDALLAMFRTPATEQPGYVMGYLRDLVALLIIGFALLVGVVVSGGVAGLHAGFGWLLTGASVLVGVVVTTVLMHQLFKLLGEPDVPDAALWSGALLGAAGSEAIKQVSSLLLASTVHEPAFQAFGIALILLVWIYYFSRTVMFAAAWAYTAPSARRTRKQPS